MSHLSIPQHNIGKYSFEENVTWVLHVWINAMLFLWHQSSVRFLEGNTIPFSENSQGSEGPVDTAV